MKKILLALILFLLPSIAFAQCNGIFPPNTLCGNATGTNALPKPTSNSILTGVPGGTNGQIQYNNNGAFGGTGPLTCPAGQFLNTAGAPFICGIPNGSIVSNSSVIGATTTYTSAQNNTVVKRSNSGSPMGDILPGSSPGFLPAGNIIYISNADTAGILSIKAGSGAAIKTVIAANGYVYVCPGQMIVFYSDGAGNYFQINSPTRCKFQANSTLFVATTGSASNDGLTASTPLLDPSSTYTLLQNNFDINGFTATIQFAAGTYPQIVFSGPIVGNVVNRNTNNVIILGDSATPSNVKIADTTSLNFAAINVYGGAAITINGFQVTSTNNSGLIADLNSNVVYLNVDWHGVHAGLNHVISEDGGRITLGGNETISSAAGCHWIAGNAGQIESSGVVTPTITITGTPAWGSGFVCTQYSGSNIVIQGSITISGTATGPKVLVSGGSYVNSGSLGGCANFPGSTAGTISSIGTCQ